MRNAYLENRREYFTYFQQRGLWPRPHLHSEVELIYVREGSAVAHADQYCTTLGQGDLFIAFPNQIHYYEDAKAGVYDVLILSQEMLYGLRETLGDYVPKSNVLSLEEGGAIQELFFGCISCKGEYRRSRRSGYANLLLGEILEQLTLTRRIKSDNSSLVSILDYCANHFEEEVTLSTLAEELHLSRYHISHLLNAKLGLGLNAYLNILRIKRACELLQERENKISEVSLAVGFGSIRSFNRAFLSVMDMTPQEYRSLAYSGKEK